MGRVQDTSNKKMRGQKERPQSAGDGDALSSKRHKTQHENEKGSKEPDSAGGRAEPTTPVKDRRIWSQEEEMDLVKVLLEHKRAARTIPLQSKTATYWTDLIALLYPGENGVTARRLYDKVRRMHHRYNEILEKKTPYRNTHEKSLFELWEKIFVGEVNTKKIVQETETEKQVPNAKRIKLVEVSDSSEEEEEEEEHEQEQVPTAKTTPKAGPSEQESSGSEKEDDDDEEVDEDGENETSPEMRRPVPSGQNVASAAQEQRRKTAFLPAEENPKAASKLGFKQSGGRENENCATERLPNVENGERRSKAGAEQARLEAEMIRSLKAELFEYVQNVRKDCMRELDEVKGRLISPARLQLARRRQELILEELSLHEEELEISQRFCRLQKEALKLRNAT